MSTSMRQLTYIEPGRLEWWDVPAPTLEAADQALIRPLVVATCDLDAAIVHGRTPLAGPFPFGHECVAEVIAVGDEVRRFAAGDRVTLPFQLSCGTCDNCRAGRSGFCSTTEPFAAFGLGEPGRRYGGFLSDVVRVPWADHLLVRVPAGIDAREAASLSDNLPDAWRCVGPQLAAHPGADVLICGGSGGLDLYVILIAKALGAGSVTYASPSARRCAAARRIGADHVAEGPWPERLGPFPVTVDASAQHDGLRCALRSAAPEGHCTSIGIYFTPGELPLPDMFTSGVTFKLAYVNAREGIDPVLDLITAGRLAPGAIEPQEVGWEDAASALADHRFKLLISREP